MTAAPPASGPALAGIDAVVLAGGLGTRLAPEVADRPKILAPVGDRPFLDLLLGLAHGRGVRAASSSRWATGPGRSRRASPPGGTTSRPRAEAVAEPEPLGTGGALRRAAASALRSDPVLVLNGDSFRRGRPRGGSSAAWHRVARPRARS